MPRFSNYYAAITTPCYKEGYTGKSWKGGCFFFFFFNLTSFQLDPATCRECSRSLPTHLPSFRFSLFTFEQFSKCFSGDMMDWCIVVIHLITLRSHFLWHVKTSTSSGVGYCLLPLRVFPFFFLISGPCPFCFSFFLFYRDSSKIDLVFSDMSFHA